MVHFIQKHGNYSLVSWLCKTTGMGKRSDFEKPGRRFRRSTLNLRKIDEN